MASRGVNKVILIGHVGKDPEMKYTPGGKAVATFSVATNESFKAKDGSQQDRTEWHRVVTWERRAEVMGEYLKKGQLIYVEGRLQTRSWDDKDGNKRYTTEIVAYDIQFLGRKGEGAGSGAGPDIPPPSEDFSPSSGGGGGVSDEDLPF